MIAGADILVDPETRHLDPFAICHGLVAQGFLAPLTVEHAFRGGHDHLGPVIIGGQRLADGGAHPVDVIGPVDLADPFHTGAFQRLGDRVVG